MKLLSLNAFTPYMRGNEVLYLQQLLNKYGYYNGALDGIFGRKTDEAVRAFQKDKGLKVDGIVGKNTWDALKQGKANEKAEKIEPSDLAKGLVAYVKDHILDLYVWGADGQTDITESWIKKMDDSESNAKRSIAHYQKLKKEGVTNIAAFDCSGLISRYLEDKGLVSSKRNCNHLWSLSKPITRQDLMEGDLVFRGDGKSFHHVGVYVGNGRVVEAKGRDDGVVMRPIDASGSSYWTHFARLGGF